MFTFIAFLRKGKTLHFITHTAPCLMWYFFYVTVSWRNHKARLMVTDTPIYKNCRTTQSFKSLKSEEHCAVYLGNAITQSLSWLSTPNPGSLEPEPVSYHYRSPFHLGVWAVGVCSVVSSTRFSQNGLFTFRRGLIRVLYRTWYFWVLT